MTAFQLTGLAYQVTFMAGFRAEIFNNLFQIDSQQADRALAIFTTHTTHVFR